MWKDSPPAHLPAGLDGVLVRAANGADVTGVERFQLARNIAAWQGHFGEAVLPWTWFGPPASSDGRAGAEAFHTAAPGAIA